MPIFSIYHYLNFLYSGSYSSKIQSLFWLSFSICQGFTFGSILTRDLYGLTWNMIAKVVIVAQFAMAVILTFLHCFAEKPISYMDIAGNEQLDNFIFSYMFDLTKLCKSILRKLTQLVILENLLYFCRHFDIFCFLSLDQKDMPQSPEYSSSFFNQMLFIWFDKTVWKARKKTVDLEDLWSLNLEDRYVNIE